jgi:hypothetical protein
MPGVGRPMVSGSQDFWPGRFGVAVILIWAATVAAQMRQVCDRLPTQVADVALSEAVSGLSWLDFLMDSMAARL